MVFGDAAIPPCHRRSPNLDARRGYPSDGSPVDALDALTLHLEDAGLTTATASVEVLANSVDDQAEVLDSRAGEISPDFLLDTLRDQAQAMKKVNRAIDSAVAEMGRC